jgi:hypothetical protein
MFKFLTARRFYKPFGVKELIFTNYDDWNSPLVFVRMSQQIIPITAGLDKPEVNVRNLSGHLYKKLNLLNLTGYGMHQQVE